MQFNNITRSVCITYLGTSLLRELARYITQIAAVSWKFVGQNFNSSKRSKAVHIKTETAQRLKTNPPFLEP